MLSEDLTKFVCVLVRNPHTNIGSGLSRLLAHHLSQDLAVLQTKIGARTVRVIENLDSLAGFRPEPAGDALKIDFEARRISRALPLVGERCWRCGAGR